jgi:hypothetical protein
MDACPPVPADCADCEAFKKESFRSLQIHGNVTREK